MLMTSLQSVVDDDEDFEDDEDGTHPNWLRRIIAKSSGYHICHVGDYEYDIACSLSCCLQR